MQVRRSGLLEAGRAMTNRVGKSGRERDLDLETASPAQLAASLDPASMLLGDMLDDREPEPGAAGVPRASSIHPIEPLEDARQVSARDPNARVRDREDGVRVGALDANLDPSAGSCEPDRIVQQVAREKAEVFR